MAGSSNSMAGILYYARECFYHHLQNESLENLKQYGSDPILLFWKAYAIIMEDRLSEGMRELEAVVEKRDVVLCAPMLLVYAHKRCKTVDREAVQKLEGKIRAERTTCGETALYYAGMFLWLCGRHDKAREYIDRMLKMSPGSREGLALRGWIDLTSGRETLVKRSLKYFDEAISGSEQPKLLDALLGKAKYFLSRFNFSNSLEVLNQAVASHPDFLPALIEKMKAQLALQDWDQAVETAHRCLTHNANCVEAHRMFILNLLAREGNYAEAAGNLSDLVQLLDLFEPKNHLLYYEVSMAFARLSGENSLVLQQTITLVERAISLAPLNPAYIIELGYQHLLNGQLKESLKTYRKAFHMDETSLPALGGIIHCQLAEGHITEAEQQLEFLAEVQSSIGKQADLVYLNALMAQKKQKPAINVLTLLQETVEVHFSSVKGTPLGMKYFQLLNPHFLLQVTKSMLKYAPTEPAASPSQADPVLRKAGTVLDPLIKSAPGMIQALYILARVKFLSGEIETAQTMAQRCLDHDESLVEAHLLMARIHLHQNNPKLCSSALEQALSSNFEVQSYPLFHLVKGMTEKQSGSLEDALSSLQTAKDFITTKKLPSSKKPSCLLPTLSLSEQVTVYLELAEIHSKLGHTHEAAKVMQDAINEFTGTSEDAKICIANADLALSRGDSEQALTLLKTITEEKPYYIQSREKMAQLYFTHRKDRKMYIACYKDLAEKLPGPPTALLLGDAYMNIQEPELALEVYEAALKKNPRDGILASKIGQALVKTHNYNKAISYYDAALKTENQHIMRCDLVELYIKLKYYDRAERTLNVGLDHPEDANDLSTLMEDTKYLTLLAKVYQKAGRSENALEALTRAREKQSRVLKRVGVEQSDSIHSQKQLAAKISCEMAEINAQLRNHDNAVRFYREALLHNEGHSPARLALAELHLNKGELEACDHECVTLLRTDPENEQAAVMRADLLFRQGEYSQAAQHFQELLGRKPDHFEALAKLIELNRRAGKLADCEAFLQQAEKVCSRSAYEPGFNYCMGLCKRYQQNMNEALHHFNQARKDSDWGERSLFRMVEICLNPENETLGGETFKPLEGDTSSSEDQLAVRTAEKLLKEIKPKSAKAEQRVRVLENFALLATKSKLNAERALERFADMASSEHDSVPLFLGMATGHMILKQTPRARNQLKRVSKMQWNSQDADEFEQSWLLLADIYIQAGKYDMAIELLKKCTHYNQSCTRAWEYYGFVSEKEQAYKDASTYYSKAWKFSNFSSPSLGYKLAFNYLKSKRFVDAIDVCHKVLEKYPQYPKIKRDILDKARMSLRP